MRVHAIDLMVVQLVPVNVTHAFCVRYYSVSNLICIIGIFILVQRKSYSAGQNHAPSCARNTSFGQ